MSAFKSKKSFLILLVLFCCSNAINARNRSNPYFRRMVTKLNRSEHVRAVEIPTSSDLSQSSDSSLQNAAPEKSDSEMTKVRRAIDAGNAVWTAAWAKGDAMLLPDTFTDDGKELVAGGKVYKGRKQILALMRETMKKRGGRAKLTVTTTDLWLDGNIAYETGTAVYEFTVNGQPQTLERRYFTIWKRQSKRGAWKIYSNTGIAKE
jgi:uncharacterized protein (TIGR02246 family)